MPPITRSPMNRKWWYAGAGVVAIGGFVVYARSKKAKEAETQEPTYTVPAGYGGFLPAPQHGAGGGGAGGGAGYIPTQPVGQTLGPTAPPNTPTGTSTMPTEMVSQASIASAPSPAQPRQILNAMLQDNKTALAGVHTGLVQQSSSYTSTGAYRPKGGTFTK